MPEGGQEQAAAPCGNAEARHLTKVDAHVPTGAQSSEATAPALEPPFAPLSPPFIFWQDALLLILLGGAIGCFGYGYLKAVSEVTGSWIKAGGNSEYPAPQTLQFGAGKLWWVGVGMGTGLVVGLTKALLHVDTVPSFIVELRNMHVDPVTGLKVGLCTLLGLLGGMPVGPEAGLGGAAGAFGMLACTWLRSFQVQAPMRRRLYVLSSMAAGFGSFLPNPLTAVLLVVELGSPSAALETSSMHLVVVLTAACSAGFAAYYSIAGGTYINPVVIALTSAAFDHYDQFYLVAGILFGIMGAALGLAYILIGGVVKACSGAAKAQLEARLGRWPRVVAMCCLGGLVNGALGYAMPLVLTDGSGQLGIIMRQGRQIGSGVLAASTFAKALAYHVSIETGFTGGIMLPMLAIGSMLGRVFVNLTSVNPAVGLSCSFISLAAALVPAPFFLAVLSMSVMLVGPQGLVPIAACAATAFLFCMGVGAPQALLAAAAKRKSGGGTAGS